jgi:hypothetical protein
MGHFHPSAKHDKHTKIRESTKISYPIIHVQFDSRPRSTGHELDFLLPVQSGSLTGRCSGSAATQTTCPLCQGRPRIEITIHKRSGCASGLYAYGGSFASTLVESNNSKQGTESETGKKRVAEVLQQYDSIVIQESLVVLQLFLGLKTTDILYLSSKLSGGFSFIFRLNLGCHKLTVAPILPAVDAYLSSPHWYAQNYQDYLLYTVKTTQAATTMRLVIGKPHSVLVRAATLLLPNVCLMPFTLDAFRSYFPRTMCGHTHPNLIP